MAIVPDTEIETSPFSGSVTRVNRTVIVNIYRFAGTNDEWTLEVVDDEGGVTVWEETFASDSEAYDEFERALGEDGIGSFAERPTQH